MTFILYLHPFSSYSQKAKMAFYEKDQHFETRLLDGSEPLMSEFASLWPIRRFPVLLHDGEFIFEATSIIEHVDCVCPGGPRLIPQNPATATRARMWDRFFDNYIQYPLQRIVYEALGREPDMRDGGKRWKDALETAYTILDAHLRDRRWVAGQTFSLADCSAAPALLYADWAHPIEPRFESLWSYRSRLLARPSYARALDEARPYRHLFPLGAPADRD